MILKGDLIWRYRESQEVRFEVTDQPGILLTYALEQNYPNPFNPTTTIAFDLPKDNRVEIVIYNLIGQKVVTLLDKDYSVGAHEVL